MANDEDGDDRVDGKSTLPILSPAILRPGPTAVAAAAPAENESDENVGAVVVGRNSSSRCPSVDGRPLETQNSIEAGSLREADDDPQDGNGYDEEGYGSIDDRASCYDSVSLSSSIRDYVFENNRRYHKYKEGRYLLPNDEPEQEREQMKHAMVLNLCGGRLHFAPLASQGLQRVLELGTGTGIWAVDMADEYPSAEILGIDLSPLQPTWVPPNVKFYVDDVEAEWEHGAETFDFVYARHMCMAVKDWPRLLKQAYQSLKPGAWIELQELRLVVQCDDNSMPSDYPFGRFLDLLKAGFAVFGIDLLGMERNQQRLREAGFVNVRELVWKVPVGTWPRDRQLKFIGLYNRSIISDGLQGVCMAAYTRGLGWTPAQVELFLVQVRRSLLLPSVHSYYTFHTVYGQKPD